MSWSRVRVASGAAALLALGSMLAGCGFKRKLVAITINPPSVTFLATNSVPVVFTATGSYIHPPDNRDITKQVTWATDVPALLQLNYQGVAGQVAPNGACGIANISASMQDNGNLVIAYATATVNDSTNPICPGGSTTTGVVTVSISGAGSVTSSPTGINCPAQACGAQFNVGQTIVLTATPNAGHTFGNWTSCPTPNGSTCSVPVVLGSTGVVATFN